MFVFLNCLTKTLTKKEKTFSISYSFVFTKSVNFFGEIFKLNFPWRTLNYTELNPINLDCSKATLDFNVFFVKLLLLRLFSVSYTHLTLPTKRIV